MKSIYLIFVVLNYLGFSNAQFPILGGITNALSSGVQGLTSNTFGDRKNANGVPAKFAHSVADGLTAGLDGIKNNGIAGGLTSFVQETGKGVKKGLSVGAYDTFKETMKEVTEAFIEELKIKAPEFIQKNKGAFYTAILIAAIQAAAKLYRSVSLAKEPPMKRAYEQIINNL